MKNTPFANNILEIENYIKDFRSKDTIFLICPVCENTFERLKKDIQNKLFTSKQYKSLFCSRKCSSSSQEYKTKINCTNCQKECIKVDSELKTGKNSFCSQSCSAQYNNNHKTTGTRRSKLEIYLENKIRVAYPNLKLLCNDKTAIGSELDFYFPQLKFAIELNGIFHYEPIYGKEKLEKIKNNDDIKYKLCYAHHIELCIIDSSSCKYLTQTQKEKYWNIVFTLLSQNIKRIKNDS